MEEFLGAGCLQDIVYQMDEIPVEVHLNMVMCQMIPFIKTPVKNSLFRKLEFLCYYLMSLQGKGECLK